MVDEQGELQRLKVTSADPAKAALCAVLEQMPPDRGLPHVMRSVIESKQPLVNERVTPEYLESIAQGPEHLQVLLATGITSFDRRAALDAGRAARRAGAWVLDPVARLRTGRSSFGRGAGGPGG